MNTGGIKNGLAEIFNRMPVVRLLRGEDESDWSKNGLMRALKGMPVFQNDAGQSAYDAAMNIGPMGLGKIVYHGSPHKFDKFDASKIGTGEGAQAYGHGVYLADAEDVASSYAGMRPAAGVSTIGGKPWSAQTRAQMLAESRARGAKGYEKAEASLRKEIDSAIASREFEAAQEAQDSLAALLDMRRSGVDLNTGENLYKADLPDEWIPKMLDWDKPLSQQPENVRLLAKDLGLAKDATGKDVYSALSNQARDMGIIKGRAAQTTLPGSQGRAAADLSEFGIPGIRYLDGGSRPNSGRITMLEQTIANLKGKGASQAAIANTQRELDAELARASYNYVVFPGLEDQVKILERNGQPVNVLADMLGSARR